MNKFLTINFRKAPWILLVLILALFLNPYKGFGQNTVLYSNIPPTGTVANIGSEPLYLSTIEIGYIINTGSTATNLNAIRLKLWNSQGIGSSSFDLRILKLEQNTPVNIGDPITYTAINTTYFNTVSILIDNSISNLASGSNTITVPPISLLPNSTYFISIRNPIAQTVYWLQSDTALSVSSLPGWSSPGARQYFAGDYNHPIPAANGTLFFELLGSLQNASVSTKTVTTINYGQTITAESGGINISESDSSISAKGICWATSTNPTLANDFTNDGAGTEEYTSTLTNLLPNTTYYVRAYVTDDTGTYYGSETTFSTNRAPVITSGDGSDTTIIDIQENTNTVATIQATDADNPVQNLTYSISGGVDALKFTIDSTSGELTFIDSPDFDSPIDSDTNNTYIVEVQVTDNGSIAKSATQTITVTVSNVAEIPTITDANSLTVGITGGTLTGTIVTNGGGGAISERGFIYAPTSVNANPIIGGTGTTKIVVSGTIGNFTKAITGLSANTSYTFKAFATNTTGSGYSEVVTFTTNGLTAGPSISCEDQTLQQNIAITPITPTNVGTIIPAGNYSKVTTFAGSTDGDTNNANPLLAKFNAPMGMVMDAERNIYFADSYNDGIKKIDGLTGAVTLFAGGTSSGVADGIGTNARFDQPSGMTYDGQGMIYIADRGNHKIRKLVISTGAVTTVAGGGSGSQSGYANAIGTAARFLRPTDVTFRTENGTAFLYVADAGNHCIRKINLTTNEVILYAGSNTSGTTDGALTTARFNNPTGLVFSSTGILYVVDRANQKIRKIEAGNVTTFAGSGTNATTNGTGSVASFADPYGIAIDGGDNIYVTQALDGNSPSANPGFSAQILVSASTNNYVRKITPNGEVTNFIGAGTRGGSDNSNGLLATLSFPTHILFDTNQKEMYVSEWFGDRIRKVEITGYTITPSLPAGLSFDDTTGTISGTPSVVSNTSVYSVTSNNYYGTSATNFNITVANLPTISTTVITSIASSTAVGGGNVTDNGGISLTERGICWSTNPNPTINDNKIVANSTATGSFVSELTGLISLITYYVRAYATNEVGTSYGTEVSFKTSIPAPSITYSTATTSLVVNSDITPLQVANTGGAVSGLKDYVSSLNGISTAGFADGAASQAQFNLPKGVVVDSQGNIFVADRANHKIRKITPAGMVSTFAGSGTQGSLDGIGTNASFYFPFSITIDKADNLYVTTAGDHLIRKIDPSANVTTIAGGNITILHGPRGITIDPDGNLYVCDSYNYRIRKVTPSGVISTFAGSGIQNFTDGTGINATFWRPTAITIDTSGNLYVSETGSPNLIRKITPAGVVITVAGRLGAPVDGTGTSAGFSDPQGMCFDLEGNLIIADYTKFRKMTPEGVVTTISNGYGFGLLNGPLDTAKFYNPAGITADAAGNVYIADEGNNTIRKISGTGFAVSPALPTGLVLNDDGSISGTPTVLSPATDYDVTATNAGGSSSFTMSIAVTDAIPTWTGTEWINGSATAATPAIIEGNYTSGGNLEVGELTVKNNAIVAFQSGHNLTVNGKLTVESGSELVLENNANLVQTTNETNSGLITIKRNTAPLKRLDYVLWSSPVTGQQLQSFSPATLSNRFYTYDGTTNFYTALSSPNTTDFEKGTGYLIRMPNDHPTTPTIWTGTFTGVPNNGYLTVIVNTGGYTALGNPYPSTMDADAFIDANSITEALYFWRKTNNSANPSYATYTKAGGVGTANSADPNGLIPNGVIQVGQGFIAAVNYIDAVFTNAMRTTNNGNQFLKTKKTDKSRIWLNLTNDSGFFSQTLVAYMDKATSGIDAAIDGRYFNDSKTALTSIIKNEEFTIQGRSLPFDASDVVPLGFKTETAGDFTLAIDHTDGLFATGQKVFLKDNLTNTLHDLSTGSYAFTSAAGVFNTRFEFRYQQALGTIENELEANTILVYKQNDKIKIDAGAQNIAGVKVYDIGGRLLVERKDINANTALIAVNGTTQVLLVHVITQEGSVVIKKIIQ